MTQELVAEQRRFTAVLVGAYILTALLLLYFFYFPSLGTPLFSDILIVLGVLVLLSSLVYAAIKARRSSEVSLVLLATVLFSILASLIPHLRLTYPYKHDCYFYFISFLNILEHGTLQPMLGWWYGLVDVHLQWPVMYLLGSMTAQVTAIDSISFLRFQQPLTGVISALAVFALAREVTRNNTIALLSVLFALASDVVIARHSQYHPQGLALTFFVLFLYFCLKSRSIRGLSYNALALVVLAAFLLTHHFSSIFVALLAIGAIGLNHLVSIFPPWIGRITRVAREIRADYSVWMIVAVAGIAYHLMIPSPVLPHFILSAIEAQPDAPLWLVGGDVPILVTLLNSSKWGILFVAGISILRVLRTPKPHELRLLVLLVCTLLAGVVSHFIIGGPSGRVILFYTPLVSVFAAMTIGQLYVCQKISIRRTQVTKVIIILISAVLLAAGFFNAHWMPALYFKSSEPNVHFYFSNVLSSVNKYGYTGEWIKRHTPQDSRYIVKWDTWILPFFFAERPMGNIQRVESVQQAHKLDGFVLVNPDIPDYFDGKHFDKERFLDFIDILYTNGVIRVGWSRQNSEFSPNPG